MKLNRQIASNKVRRQQGTEKTMLDTFYYETFNKYLYKLGWTNVQLTYLMHEIYSKFSKQKLNLNRLIASKTVRRQQGTENTILDTFHYEAFNKYLYKLGWTIVQ